jgi:hypothetical protein
MKHVHPPQPDAEYVLAALRTVSSRLKQIDNEIIQTGIALKKGLITPARAISLCERSAPGCLDLSELEASEILK